jgi:flagellar biosynthesis protein FlhA
MTKIFGTIIISITEFFLIFNLILIPILIAIFTSILLISLFIKTLINIVYSKKNQNEKIFIESKENTNIKKIVFVDNLSIELGRMLLPLVDEAQGEKLLKRILSIRFAILKELGIIMPRVQIKNNLNLEANMYVIKIKGVKVAQAEAYINKFLAIGIENVIKQLSGITTVDPAYGLPSIWIEPSEKEQAEKLGCILFDATAVITAHLAEVVKKYSYKLLDLRMLKHLLDIFKRENPDLTEEVDKLIKIISLSKFRKILSNLLKEGIPIVDFHTILETLLYYSEYTKDEEKLTEYVRISLRHFISDLLAMGETIYCSALDPKLEELILKFSKGKLDNNYLLLDNKQKDKLFKAILNFLEYTNKKGYLPVIICSTDVRRYFKKIIEKDFPKVKVISYDEVDEGYKIKILEIISMSD